MNKEVIISSRIRFARNIKDYPFYSKLDETSAKEIIAKIGEALGDEYTETDFGNLEKTTALSYLEQHKVSSEFVESRLPHALFEKGDLKIMACEEDHIRLQCIKEGFCLGETYKEAKEVERLLDSKLNIAFSDEFGYLTHCPTNLGTAMRVSLMVFLPGITKTGKYGSVASSLDKLGVTIRGIYGEGSEASGSVYQISNTMTLGTDEESVIKKIEEIAKQIVQTELLQREKIKNADENAFFDRVMRSLGTLKYARILSSSEFTGHYEILRMALSFEKLQNISYEKLDKLFTDVMPANICVGANKNLNERERDIKRADIVRSALN